jgi:hypothetical protein
MSAEVVAGLQLMLVTLSRCGPDVKDRFALSSVHRGITASAGPDEGEARVEDARPRGRVAAWSGRVEQG